MSKCDDCDHVMGLAQAWVLAFLGLAISVSMVLLAIFFSIGTNDHRTNNLMIEGGYEQRVTTYEAHDGNGNLRKYAKTVWVKSNALHSR